MLVVYVVVIFVNAFICCLIAVELAAVKGHDTVKWGWYGFLFGPIGVLGAVGLPDRDGVYARSRIKEATSPPVGDPSLHLEKLGGKIVRNELREVTRVSFVNYKITDSELESLSGLTGLKTLDLGGTKITNAGLAHLVGLSNLETLSLHSTLITDAGLLHLKGLARLKTLWLGGTRVTGEGIAELKRALPECQIS